MSDEKEEREEEWQWFAACKGVSRLGPFETEVDAWRALELSVEDRRRLGRVHAIGAYVWPEKKTK